MNAMALQPMMAGSAPIAAPRWLGNGLAAGCALALHGAVALALLVNWQLEPPAPQPAVLKTQLVMLPAPQPEPVAAVAPAPAVPEPVPVQAAVEPAPAPVAPPKPDPALLARKRVQEREREQAKVQKQQEQQRAREREQAEQQARSAQQAEQARQQQLADAAKARAQAQAQAAELASRQYLPISKDAPDYPQRALDKGIQGDCTVEYQVNSLGRVENPQVVGSCHPMFIRPSLAAAKTFVYQPRMVDGRAVQVPGVRNTFHYRIE